MTPLHLAAESGCVKVVLYLTDIGADINSQDNDGVILNADRLADWILISLIFKQVINCCLKIPMNWHLSSKDSSNSILYVAGSEENETILNTPTRTCTIQSWYMHIILVYSTTKSVNLEWLSLQHFLLLSPLPTSEPPYLLQPAMPITTQWNALLRKELTYTSRIKLGYGKLTPKDCLVVTTD